MTDQHPITPPPDLLKEWIDAWYGAKVKHENMTDFVAIQAARWGADQELEACCAWLRESLATPSLVECFCTARRPKPQSLKEQALGALSAIALGADDTREFYQDIETIKAALEALPDAD